MDPLNDTPTRAENALDLSLAIADAQALAQEQVQAAWQIYLDRIREQLESGWRDSLEQIYRERFGEIESRLRDRYESAIHVRAEELVEQRLEPVRSAAKRDVLEKVNSFARRMRAAENRDEVRKAVLDAAGELTSRVALFLPGELDLQAAPALANALESKDTVVAAATETELSSAVLERFSGAADGRVYLFPLVVHEKAYGVLAAAPDTVDGIGALELLASLAAPYFEDPPEPVIIEPPAPKPAWSDLTRAEQEVHLRAQRFARNRIAELVLNQIRRVKTGRQNRDLYTALRHEIDSARTEYARFFENCPSMVDYLHVELVRNLTKDDPGALGPEYPGPLTQ